MDKMQYKRNKNRKISVSREHFYDSCQLFRDNDSWKSADLQKVFSLIS